MRAGGLGDTEQGHVPTRLMVWLTRQERIMLAGLGTAALLALGILIWQRQRPALVIAGQPGVAQAIPWQTQLEAARQIDVNTAPVSVLTRLPGVGPTLAARIVAYRTQHGRFHNAEELTDVRGIGPKTVDALRGHVTLR